MTPTKLFISVLIGEQMLEFMFGLLLGAGAGAWWVIKSQDLDVEDDQDDEDSWNYR